MRHHAMLQLWVAHDEISYDTCIAWGYIVAIQIRFMDDCGWLLMMHIVHICCLHGDLHKDKEKYKAWVHNFIIWWWATHFFYVVVIMPSKMRKVHMVQLWCRIPIVLGSHVVEDCCCWWYQEILTNDHELMVF